ncbi:class I SAM-dependent methyltransferase [Nannocystaceae bacterium ST9]
MSARASLVQGALPYFGDDLLLLDELRVELERLGVGEPVLLRASELDKLDRVLAHGTDRAGYPGDRRWAHDAALAHVDVILATTPEQNRKAAADPSESSSLRKLPIIEAPMLLVYAAAAFEALPVIHEHRFRAPANKPAALRAIFPIRKHALPEGWFRSDEGLAYRGLVERALREPGARGRIVEVGCWLGRSTTWVARLCRSFAAELICVDSWAGSSDRFDAAYRDQVARRDVEAEFRGHLDALGVSATCRRESSQAAAAELAAGSIDLVFLDGSHDRDAVAADLAAWRSRLRPGGIMAGHDFGERHPGVVEAVEAFADAQGRTIERAAGSVWWLRL